MKKVVGIDVNALYWRSRCLKCGEKKVCYQQNCIHQANNFRSREGSNARQLKIVRELNIFERYDLVPLEEQFPEKHQEGVKNANANKNVTRKRWVSHNLTTEHKQRGESCGWVTHLRENGKDTSRRREMLFLWRCSSLHERCELQRNLKNTKPSRHP